MCYLFLFCIGFFVILRPLGGYVQQSINTNQWIWSSILIPVKASCEQTLHPLATSFFFSFLLTANLVYLYQFSHYTTEFVCMAVFSVSFNSSFKIHPKHIDFLFSQTFQSKFSKTWRLVFKCCQKRGDSSYNRDKPKKRVSPISRSYSYSYSVYVRYCLFFLFFYASKCFLSTPWAWSTTVLPFTDDRTLRMIYSYYLFLFLLSS